MSVPSPATTLFDFEAVGIDGHVVALSAYRGQVALVVNVASQCGYTPQYRGLEALYREHRAQGFVVLGFPCNQFGRQEPGAEQDIQTFCSTTYDVTFPMFRKTEVNGPHAHPIYRFLKSARPGWFGRRSITWNFTKFLVDRTGQPVARFGSSTTPARLDEHIRKVLA